MFIENILNLYLKAFGFICRQDHGVPPSCSSGIALRNASGCFYWVSVRPSDVLLNYELKYVIISYYYY